MSGATEGKRIERHCAALFYRGPPKLRIPQYDESRVTLPPCLGSVSRL